MPTMTQCQELINNTNPEWVTLNNVNGRKFINKTDSYKYIFLPSAGEWYGGPYSSEGKNGFYWSTSYSDHDYAYEIDYANTFVSMNNTRRSAGKSVRPVRPWTW